MANPYRTDINIEGRKLQNKVTKGLLVDEWNNFSQEGIADFKEVLDEANNKFAFGTVLNTIQFHTMVMGQ